MDEPLNLPSTQSIKFAFDRLFNSGHSVTKLRDSALGNRLLPSSADALCVPGRSIAWKLFLSSDEPLQAGPSSIGTASSLFLDTLRISRSQWTKLVLNKFKAPDGTYEDGLQVPGSSELAKTGTRTGDDLERNNPLSLDQNNPWNEWFNSVELRKTILQDVERTFPEIPFFRDAEVQTQLTQILFLYSVLHPDIGYRQGMHEVLAPLYLAVHYDSLVETDESLDPMLNELCSRNWVTADSWTLFDHLMRTMYKWYEWREPSKVIPASSDGGNALPRHVNIDVPSGPLQLQAYVAPIVQTCNRIQSVLLRSTDPMLWKSLQATGIEPQIYGIRWLRLLFTREFSMQDSMRLWDAVFACDPSLEIAPWMCVAMLIRIRNELIPADYSGQLSALLRYPTFPDAEHTHTSLLLTQAVALQMAPTPATGTSLILENRNRLNIEVDVPHPPPPPLRRGRGADTRPQPLQGHPRGHLPRQPSQQGLPDFARGILDRGESLGINKTLMSAVSEIRRNIPDLNSFARPPTSPNPFQVPSYAQPPPPLSPRVSLDPHREVDRLRTDNREVGASLGWIVDVLLQDDSAVVDKQLLAFQRSEALESLSHIRDVFNGATPLDLERLVGDQQSFARRIASQVRVGPPPFPSGSVPKSPRPVPVADSHRNSRSVSSFPSPPNSPQASQSGRHAPWNHTPSSFSSSNPSLPAALPRMPPPASKSKADSRPRTEVQRDPLGAL